MERGDQNGEYKTIDLSAILLHTPLRRGLVLFLWRHDSEEGVYVGAPFHFCRSMSAIGTKRTWPCALHMSANDPKRTWIIAHDLIPASQLPNEERVAGEQPLVEVWPGTSAGY